jgi:DNA-binding protein H-NS
MARSPHLELESMSDTQIREIIEHARETLTDRFTQKVDEFRALADEAGYEVIIARKGEGDTRQRRSRSTAAEGPDRRSKVRAKYRNPDNAHETWTGRGREPRWMTELVQRGRSREEMLISPQGGRSQKAEEPEAA